MFRYKLLECVAERFEDTSLENVLLLSCQHLLEPQKRMFELLLKEGLKPENCIIVGKNYSTCNGVMNSLIKMGCIVAPFSNEFEPLRPFGEWFEERLTAFLKEKISNRRLDDYRKVIVLDDGGYLHCIVNRLFPTATNIVGIEQTSSGHNKIVENGIAFPTISVARSYHKQWLESPYIGDNGSYRIIRYMRYAGKKDPNILVIGLGVIGRQTAGRLFVIRGHRGYATDLRLDDRRIADNGAFELLNHRGKIMTANQAMDRIGEFDVIVGTTGRSVLKDADISRLNPRVSLISMSSSDHEFPPLPFRHADGKVHDDCHLDERCLVNSGFPITFDGCGHAMPPRQIELTIGLLLTRIFSEAGGSDQLVQYVVEQIRDIWQPDKGSKLWYRNFNNRSS